MTQNNEELITDLLHMTSATTPRMSLNEMQGTSNTTTNTLVTEDFPLLNLVANQKDEILTGTQTQEFERKDRMSTKVIDETTLRIYFPKASNVDPVTQSKSTTASLSTDNSDTAAELKDKAEEINIQDQTCY